MVTRGSQRFVGMQCFAMDSSHGQNFGGVNSGQPVHALPQKATCNDHDPHIYQQVLKVVKHVLHIVIENEFEESCHALAVFTMNLNFHGSHQVSQYISKRSPDGVIRVRVLEAFVHWVRDKTRALNDFMEIVLAGQSVISSLLGELKLRLEQVCHQSPQDEVVAEFIHMVVSGLLGRDAACLSSVLAGALSGACSLTELMGMVERPVTLLAVLVRTLEDVQANASRVAMDVYEETWLCPPEYSKSVFFDFFAHYTVDPCTGALDVYEDAGCSAFTGSQFKVHLISSYGSLMELLCRIESLCEGNKQTGVALAVDFEGVNLSRDGSLCLMQLSLSCDPSFVYIVDVHALGKWAFTLQTPNGMCMKGVLEDQGIRKVWFDPRHDVDALYHQFGVLPQGVFDLQLAEVAYRRNRGLSVKYVMGLNSCLGFCPVLPAEQKAFAKQIDWEGKRLFEPRHGGDYAIFQQRPLHQRLLVYSAHDCRYMFLLYETYLRAIGPQWSDRVLAASAERVRWCLSEDCRWPEKEAPVF